MRSHTCERLKQTPLPPFVYREGPTLRTLHELETILRSSETPKTVSHIMKRLPRMIAATALREAIDHYRRLGFVSEGSKGVMWTLNTDREFWESALTWDSGEPARS